MKLITKTIINRFNQVGDQSRVENPTFIAKFFDSIGSGTWYATEYNPETNICYGYVTGLACDEWGTFSIDELQSIVGTFGKRIERDIYFSEITYTELLKERG